MMDDQIKPFQIFVAFFVMTIIGLIAGAFLANYVFMQWQSIPMDYYRVDLIYKYYQKYADNAEVVKVIKASSLTCLIPVVVLNIITGVALFNKPKREQFGSARFANFADVKKTGLILTDAERAKANKKKPSNPSVLVGKYKGQFLEYFGNEFFSIAAPTRSGKGVGIVIPNLLHYRDSVVVLDVKNENWDLTAGFRSQFQECFLFAPKAKDKCTHRWNPLDYISRDETERMADIQNIANIMYPDGADQDSTSAFFNANAQRLFTGMILYMLETPERPCTMAELMRLATPTIPLEEWIEKVIEDRQEQGRSLSSECVQALMSYAGNSAESTRSGIDSTLKAPLNIFTDPMVAAATSASDFRLDEVRKKRMSIYVGIQPNELDRFGRLLNLFFSQLINLNTRVLPEQDPALKYQCLLMLDEFTALGRVDIINKSVAYIAGYNLRLMLIFQNIGQLEQHYGKEGSSILLSNIACKVVFAPTEIEEAERYSRMLGSETIKGKSISKNRGKGGGGSVSTSDQKRELMLPQEMLELDPDKQIVKYKAYKPIFDQKIKFHEEPVFCARLSSELDSTGRQKGMPIRKACLPPKVDVIASLDSIRGTKEVAVTQDELDNMSGEELIKEHSDYLAKLSASLGFDADFFINS